MPIVSDASRCWWSLAVSSPVPQPRSTTVPLGTGCSRASRSSNGRRRSAAKRRYWFGSQVSVPDVWRFDLDEWLDRVRALRHVDSALRPLTDEEFAAGLATVERLAGGQATPSSARRR